MRLNVCPFKLSALSSTAYMSWSKMVNAGWLCKERYRRSKAAPRGTADDKVCYCAKPTSPATTATVLQLTNKFSNY